MQSKKRKQSLYFRKNHANPITIPKHEPIKKIYVEMVKSVVEAEDEEIKEENQIW